VIIVRLFIWFSFNLKLQQNMTRVLAVSSYYFFMD